MTISALNQTKTARKRNKRLPALLLGAVLAHLPAMAAAVPLSFDQMVGPANGSNLLGATATERTIYFKDVATDNGQTVDAKITTTLKDDTHFADQTDPNAQNYFGDAGYIPDYRNSAGGPQDDLGLFYYGNGIDNAEDGITMTMEFFNGTADQSGTFTNSLVLSTLELAVYDVDGEASQSEYFFAQKQDGLVSYALGNTPQALVATDLGNSIRFDGPGTNFSESDATGAAILYYELTDAISLSFGSVQTSGPSQNAVFSAIDGDLSMFALDGFSDPVEISAVPLPASALLLLTGLAGLLVGYRKSSVSQAARGLSVRVAPKGPIAILC